MIYIETLDAITGEPVPFVNAVFDNGLGATGNMDGIIELPNEDMRVTLSHISYEPQTVNAHDSDTWYLMPKVYNLDEAIIRPEPEEKTKAKNWLLLGLVLYVALR